MPNRATKDERAPVRQYGAPVGPAASVEAVPPRNVPSEADAATRHRMIAEDRASSVAEGKKGLYQVPPAERGSSPPEKLNIGLEETGRRLRNRKRQIDQASDS